VKSKDDKVVSQSAGAGDTGLAEDVEMDADQDDDDDEPVDAAVARPFKKAKATKKVSDEAKFWRGFELELRTTNKMYTKKIEAYKA
jgi:hypothetical protein